MQSNGRETDCEKRGCCRRRKGKELAPIPRAQSILWRRDDLGTAPEKTDSGFDEKNRKSEHGQAKEQRQTQTVPKEDAGDGEFRQKAITAGLRKSPEDEPSQTNKLRDHE